MKFTKKFTKQMVQVIERECSVKLTEEQIEAGKLNYISTNPYTGSKKDISIVRDSNGSLRVLAHFVDDDYYFGKGIFQKCDSKFVQCLRSIR